MLASLSMHLRAGIYPPDRRPRVEMTKHERSEDDGGTFWTVKVIMEETEVICFSHNEDNAMNLRDSFEAIIRER